MFSAAHIRVALPLDTFSLQREEFCFVQDGNFTGAMQEQSDTHTAAFSLSHQGGGKEVSQMTIPFSSLPDVNLPGGAALVAAWVGHGGCPLTGQ